MASTTLVTSISLPPRVEGPITGNFLLQFHYAKWKTSSLQKVMPVVEVQIQWWGQQKPDQIQNIPLLSKQSEIKSKFSKITIQYPLATEVMQVFNYFSDQKALRLVFYVVNNTFRDVLGETLLNLSNLQPNKVMEEITLPIHATKKENLVIAELCMTVTWEMKNVAQKMPSMPTTTNTLPQFENFEDFSKFHKKKSDLVEEKTEENHLDALMKIAQNLKQEMKKFTSNVSELKTDVDTPEKPEKRKTVLPKEKTSSHAAKAKTLASPKKSTSQPSKPQKELEEELEDFSSSTSSTYSSSDEEEDVDTTKTDHSTAPKNYLEEEDLSEEDINEEESEAKEEEENEEVEYLVKPPQPLQQINHLTSSLFQNLFIHKIEEYTIFFDIKTAIPNEKMNSLCFFKCKAPFLNVEVPTEKFNLTESMQSIDVKKLFSIVFPQSELYSILEEKGIAFELYTLNNKEESFLGVFTIPLHPITKCFRLNKNADKLTLQYEWTDQELPFMAYDKGQFTCKNPLFGSTFVDFIVNVYFGTEKQIIRLLSHLTKQDVQEKPTTPVPVATTTTTEPIPSVEPALNTKEDKATEVTQNMEDVFASLPTMHVPEIMEDHTQYTEYKSDPQESPFDDIKDLLNPHVLRKKVDTRVQEDDFELEQGKVDFPTRLKEPKVKTLQKENQYEKFSSFHDTDLVNFGDVLDDHDETTQFMLYEQYVKPNAKHEHHHMKHHDISPGTITIKIKSAAGLQDAVPFISKHYPNLSTAVTGGLNPFVECKILPQDFESEDELSSYQTKVEARTFCPKFHFEKSIPLQTNSEIIQHFKKNEALFSIYHRVPGATLKSNHIKLGTAIVSLASLATKTKNNTVSGWFNIYSFEGKVIGTLDIAIQLDATLADVIFAEERKDLLTSAGNENPMVSLVNDGEVHRDFYDICRFTIVVDELLIPTHISKAFAPSYMTKNETVFPIYFYLKFVDLENQEFESRVYRSSSNIERLNISFAHEFKKSITPKYAELSRHKKLQIKVYICCEDVNIDQENSIKKQSKKVGTCFVDLGALLSKRSSSKLKSAWISGLYSIINEDNPQTIGNCKIKCMCETVRHDPRSILELEEHEEDETPPASSSSIVSSSSSDITSDSDLEHLDASNEAKQFIRDELRSLKSKKQDKSSSAILYTTIPSHTSPLQPYPPTSPSFPTFSNYLNITIEEALNLPFITDTFSFTPTLPSCYVTIIPQEHQIGKFSTHIIREKVNPVWDSHFKLGINEDITKDVVLQVWHCFSSLDKNTDKLLGECIIPLDGLTYFDKLDGWYAIQKSQAQLKITIQPEKPFKMKRREPSIYFEDSSSPHLYEVSAVSAIDHLPRILSPPSPETTYTMEETDSYEEDVEFLKLKLQEQLRELDPWLQQHS